MKFMAKTTMYTATFRDLVLANTQGTLVDHPLSGYRDGNIKYLSSYNATRSVFLEYLFLIFSICVLWYGIVKYRKMKQSKQIKSSTNLKTPLV